MNKFIRADWKTQLADNYTFLESYLRPTKYRSDSYPCEKGCLREVRQYNDVNYGLCTDLDGKRCDDIELNNEQITLYSLDINQLADTIISRLADLSLTKSILTEHEESQTYHVATYDESDEFSRSLSVYVSILPQYLTNPELSIIFSKRQDFVLFTLGDVSRILNNPANPFSSRIIKLNGETLSKQLSAKFQENLARRFADILLTPLAPRISDQAISDHELGVSKRIKQKNNGVRRGNDLKQEAEKNYKLIFPVALTIVKAKPNFYSASSLAEAIIKKQKIDIAKATLRKQFANHPEIKTRLKKHHKSK